MCILTFITRHCERFPFVLIGNRDEDLARATGALGLDSATGLVWAVDQLAGGSWMGIEPRSGRFAVLTNCRRSPAAPLTCRANQRDDVGDRAEVCAGQAPSQWRGAAPLAHIRAHTAVVSLPTSCPAPHRECAAASATLAYRPSTSRGTVVKDFLQSGALPRDVTRHGSDAVATEAGETPYYAGFNLITCDDLRRVGESADVLYTTNRYGAEHRCPAAPGEVHTLQNSFLNNVSGEPISARLGDLFSAALARVVGPIAAAGATAPSAHISPLSAAAVVDVATALADTCLCDRHAFDLVGMATSAAAMHAQLHSNDPLLGLKDEELLSFFGGSRGADGSGEALHLCDGGAAVREAHLQSSIFKAPRLGHGTRVQSMVMVERVAAPSSVGGGHAAPDTLIHFCQRDTSFDSAAQRVVSGPWRVYRILQDGTCVLDSGSPVPAL
ncbi:NRDE protein [Novymonas esmeraldas]|uniref:NRDE protein n=1 Tax=Novymonas esmeraldas TaxID=1808958 RepID=A0AAW0ETE4_9TRYP